MTSTQSDHLHLQKRTFGEQLLARLVSKLPRESYFGIEQPKLVDRDGLGWKPDFAIVCSRLGVLILEIKDWFSIVEADREFVTIQKRDNTLERLPNPVETAQNYAYVLADMFKQREELMVEHRGIRRLAFPWHYAVALPNLSRKLIQQIETANVWERGVALSRDELKSPELFEAAIKTLRWRFPMQRPMSNDTLDVIRGVLCPSVKILTPDGEDIGTETHLQSLIINENLPAPELPGMAEPDKLHVRLVRGVAGSGKTLVLIRRALQLKEKHPDHRILVLAFNRDLSVDLERRINHDSIEVMDFHQFCYKINGFIKTQYADKWLKQQAGQQIADAGLSIDFVADEIAWRKEMELFDDREYLETLRQGRGAGLLRSKREVINTLFNQYRHYQETERAHGQPWADWQDMPLLALEKMQSGNTDYHHAYEVVLIDEAQDFAPVWFKVIRQALKPGGSLFICDDPTQSLFRYYSWKQKGVDVTGHTRILRVPFRNTRQISQAAHSLIQADNNLKQSDDITAPNLDTYALPNGPLPSLVRCSDAAFEADLIEAEVMKLLQDGISEREIGVLCYDNFRLERWQALVHAGVYVSSFAKMKGLEFQAVFIPHLQDLFRNQADDDSAFVTEQRRKLFTAMTRARENLIMTYSGELPQPVEVLHTHVYHEVIGNSSPAL